MKSGSFKELSKKLSICFYISSFLVCDLFFQQTLSSQDNIIKNINNVQSTRFEKIERTSGGWGNASWGDTCQLWKISCQDASTESGFSHHCV